MQVPKELPLHCRMAGGHVSMTVGVTLVKAGALQSVNFTALGDLWTIPRAEPSSSSQVFPFLSVIAFPKTHLPERLGLIFAALTQTSLLILC